MKSLKDLFCPGSNTTETLDEAAFCRTSRMFGVMQVTEHPSHVLDRSSNRSETRRGTERNVVQGSEKLEEMGDSVLTFPQLKYLKTDDVSWPYCHRNILD
jgi:hypothetical protein